jgi:hypothetical protein
LEWALWLAERGFRILQLNPGSKNPKRGFGWLRTSTTDPEIIRAWFSEDPTMNYGVCPGDHHVIIDLDNKPHEGKDGRLFFADLEIENGDVSDTFIVSSPSGGRHLYLKTSRVVGNAHAFPASSGIDIRGAHGYVVGPASELIAGKCKITDTPGPYTVDKFTENFQLTPAWLDGYLREKRDRDPNADSPLIPWDMQENIEKAEKFLKERAPAVQGRNGNQWTYDTAAFLRDFGISEAKAVDLIFATGWNERCSPPWPLDELCDVIEHSYRYAQNQPGTKADFMGMYERLMGDVELTEAIETGIIKDDLDEHLFNADAFTKRGKRRDFIIPGWLPDRGFTALLARRGVGKSAIMTDIACRLACDMDWYDLPMKRECVAIYLCGEDDEGLELNLIAWMKNHNREVPKDRMIISDKIMNLMDAKDVERWARKLVDKVRGRPAIVFLDTWQRASSQAKQNDDADMQLCVHHAEALAKSLNGPLIGAFHPPKHNLTTIHGSAVTENTSVAIWNMEEEADGRKLTVDRVKGAKSGSYCGFQFDTVELEELDSFGKPQTGIVPRKWKGTGDENSEQREATRLGWAWLIRGLFERNNARKPDEIRLKRFNKTQVSEVLEKLCKDESFLIDYGQKAEEANIQNFTSQSVIRKALDSIFPPGFKPILFDDFIQLSMSPLTKQFELKPLKSTDPQRP